MYQHKSVEEADKTLNSIINIINEGIWDWQANTGLVDRSPSWYKMLGYQVNCFEKNVFTWETIIHPDDYSMVMTHFELFIKGKIDEYRIEYRCKKADNSYLWIVDKAEIIEYDTNGNILRMIGSHENIHEQKIAQIELTKQNQLLLEGNATLEKKLAQKNNELKNKNQQLEQKIQEVMFLSLTDSLTGIGNRRFFEKKLSKEIARAKRYQYPLSLIYFDIDHFKHLNDKNGHEIGDLVLKMLAAQIKEKLKDNFYFSRWGGEEFTIILPNTNLTTAHIFAEFLRNSVQKIEFKEGLFITSSFGVAQFSENDSFDDFLSKADKKLYEAKHLGRNRVEY